jgi:hypothetical protein
LNRFCSSGESVCSDVPSHSVGASPMCLLFGVDRKWLVSGWNDAIDPGCVKSRTLANGAEKFFSAIVPRGAAFFLRIRKCRLEELCSPYFTNARLFTRPGPKADISETEN